MDINVFYTKKNNMGDLLNEYIIPIITGCSVVHSPQCHKFDVMGIGSCAGAIWGNIDNSPQTFAKDAYKFIASSTSKRPCAVWGSGFIKDLSDRKLYLLRRNTEFIAVRGQYSQRIIEAALGKKINPVLCDGGILASLLIEKSVPKKYSVGFIPHFKEQHLCKEKGFWDHFAEKERNSTVIDLTDDPIEVLKEIASCETIISSSLHGCICADSFHIPNVRIKISEIPGSGFKFDDYYSCYGLDVPAVCVDQLADLPTINYVIDKYRIAPDAIEEKKKSMADCLTKFVNDNVL